MISVENRKEPDTVDWVSGSKKLVSALFWFVGLVSTIYLVGDALFLVLLTVVFLPSSSGYTAILDDFKIIAINASPVCLYAAIGFVGLKFGPSSRFKTLGLSAILAETALAIYAYTHPESLPMFTDWLL